MPEPPAPRPPELPAPPIPALPISVPLVQAETLDSYLRRLAHANHHTTRTLLRYLCYPRPAEIAALHPERLAAAAGRPLDQLASRLHRLDPAPNRHGHKPRADLEARPACRRCTTRHGIPGPVIRAAPAHHTICRRHQLWIGPGTHTTADQHDLRPFPEMLRAQRRHHRLLRHHPGLAPTAHRHAERLLRHWLSRDELPPTTTDASPTTSTQPTPTRPAPTRPA